jgi:hypothetical protein
MGDKIEETVEFAFEYGDIDGEHHKQWIIDQMIRILLGPEYSVWVDRHNTYNATQDHPPWDTGIAP